MTQPAQHEPRFIVRWVRTMPLIFLVLGLSFGTWLGRLPSVRDHLQATTLEMSIYGLTLASGSLLGLLLSGRIVNRFIPRAVLRVGVLAQAVALPVAAIIILYVTIPGGLAILFVYGFAFSVSDVAMNVSGANAESAFGKPRLPLMHAGYSIGTVVATGLSAVTEAIGLAAPLHFAIIGLLSSVFIVFAVRNLPIDEQTVRHAAEQRRNAPHTEMASLPTGSIPVIEAPSGVQAGFGTSTGSISVVTAAPDRASVSGTTQVKPGSSAAPQKTRYNPWKDPRILLAGVITLSLGMLDGAAADWLPIALVDGRGFSNEAGAAMLSVFFASVMAVRLAGSWLILRFGRVAVLRVSVIAAAVGIVVTILSPGIIGVVIGTILWGAGSGIGWPIAISAAADRAKTAAQDVAAVSAIGYGSMLIGPMAFGFLGEFTGLLTAYWFLLPFIVCVLFASRAVRPLSR